MIAMSMIILALASASIAFPKWGGKATGKASTEVKTSIKAKVIKTKKMAPLASKKAPVKVEEKAKIKK